MVFQLLHDQRHNVLLTRFSGAYVATDISLRDKAVGRFVARNGLARGIMDYSAVEAVDIPIEVVVERSSQPPLLPGQARVIVAPREPLWAMNRIFAAHRLFRQGEEPILVRRIEEAYQALSMVDPVFEPVAVDPVSRLEGVTHDVLAGIEFVARRDRRRGARAPAPQDAAHAGHRAGARAGGAQDHRHHAERRAERHAEPGYGERRRSQDDLRHLQQPPAPVALHDLGRARDDLCLPRVRPGHGRAGRGRRRRRAIACQATRWAASSSGRLATSNVRGPCCQNASHDPRSRL